jgi:hypothetical protein
MTGTHYNAAGGSARQRGGQANFYIHNCSDLPSFPPLRTTGTPSDESGQLTGEQVGDKRNSIGE